MAKIDISPQLPLHLDARDLRLVVAAAQAGSLSRASAVLHLTQSTLSHHLANLESRLGGALFHRLGRRLPLTPLGERLRDAAVPILASLAALEEDLRRGGSTESGVLRFATECYTTYPWLARVARRFQRRWPAVRVRIVAEATRRPLEELDRGQLDLALVMGTVPRDRRRTVTALFRDELVAVVSRHDAWADRRYVALHEFRNVHLLTYAPEPIESSFVRETLLPAGALPREMSGVPLTEGLVELARAGLGVAVLARWAIAAHRRDRDLRILKIGRSGTWRTWSTVRLQRHPDAARVDAFTDLLREEGLRLTRGSAG